MNQKNLHHSNADWVWDLGITPNGYAEPDFLGWEVKQYGVRDFRLFWPLSPVTLMTPEPTGGIYRSGVPELLKRLVYADRARIPDRFNFGGRYDLSRGPHHLTELRMVMHDYDAEKGAISGLDGGSFSPLHAESLNAMSPIPQTLLQHNIFVITSL